MSNEKKIYKESFQFFLKSTDEKKVIFEFLKKSIDLGKVQSVLDIGGGNGSIALPLARMGKLVTVVEPNQHLSSELNKYGVKTINLSWEKFPIKSRHDLVIAAYVFTHFNREDIPVLLKKMYRCVNTSGSLLILAVDPERGSWRQIHTYFYKIIGYNHRSSTALLGEIIRTFKNVRVKRFSTYVTTKTIKDMIKALTFDFFPYKEKFEKHRVDLGNYLKRYKINKKLTLEMVHQAYIIRK